MVGFGDMRILVPLNHFIYAYDHIKVHLIFKISGCIVVKLYLDEYTHLRRIKERNV